MGRDALELLRDWAASDGTPTKFEPQRLVRLHWKCERLRKCHVESNGKRQTKSKKGISKDGRTIVTIKFVFEKGMTCGER